MKNLTLIVAFFIVFIVIVLIGFNFLAFVYIYYTENQTITPGYSYNIVRHIDNAEEGLYLNWIESFNFQIITNEKNNIQTTSQSLLINTITANDLSALQNWGNYWGKSAKINIDYSTDVFIENMTLAIKIITC